MNTPKSLQRVTNWTRPQTLAAFHIYTQLPFGQLHRHTPKIKQLAEWIGRTPGAVALKLVNLASLDPAIVARGLHGMVNASALDRAIWNELHNSWDTVALEAVAEYEKLAKSHGVVADEDLLNDAPVFDVGKTRSVTVQQRVNQARFRKAVLTSYNATCCVTGLQHEKLVIASHIVPWSEDTHNRLNPKNGLCLSALHDRAFDQGLITVTLDFKVQVSKKLKTQTDDSFMVTSLLQFDGKPIRLPERFKPDPGFLEHHNRRFGFTT